MSTAGITRGRVTQGLRRQSRTATEALRLRPLVALGRVALWSAVVLVLGRGVVSFLPEGPTRAPVSSSTARPGKVAFPDRAAMALAVRFVTDYLSFNQLDPGAQRERLAPYLAEGVVVGEGFLTGGSAQVAQVVPMEADVRGTHLAVVTVAALLETRRWVHLAVPVVAGPGGALAVAAPPAFVAAPARATLTPEMTVGEGALHERDDRAASMLTPALKAFFVAYAAGDPAALAYYLAPGAHVEGLAGVVTLQALSGVTVSPPSTGERSGARTARASVRWGTPEGASLTQTYQLALVEAAGRFYVSALGPIVPGSANEQPTAKNDKPQRKEQRHDR